MKKDRLRVTHLRSGEIKTVEDTKQLGMGTIYLFSDNTWGYILDYEPVAVKKRWRDVTEECIVQNGWEGGPLPVLTYDLHPIARISMGYRLRKVKLFKEANAALNLGQHLHPTQWAFIVDKEEE